MMLVVQVWLTALLSVLALAGVVVPATWVRDRVRVRAVAGPAGPAVEP